MPDNDRDIGISYLVLLLCCVYRICSTKNDFSVKRYRLRSSYYNYLLGILVFYCTTEPLVRLFMGLSIANLDGQSSSAPFEVGMISFSPVIYIVFFKFSCYPCFRG
ncbi:ABC transporter C family member 2 [Platanthera zijinensis]|uniref:ABC transporter C family member 2 n=1 Tax=Platanthera zijinensis TaxID=2320716 RepID=A0AAP0BG54_9ASPA